MSLIIKDEILNLVEKPARYTGNELNIVTKNINEVKMRFAFCFPDVYEIGMSHLGMKILYHLLNEREDTYCERVFAPWIDMESQMRAHKIPLYGLESKDPLSDFDILGFTLQYEMSYTNVLNMLNLGGIPLLSIERQIDHPFVCAGGPCTYNPEPIADFIDFFVIGEAEEVINDILNIYTDWKADKKSRKDFLTRIAGIEGVYVPSFYSVKYNSEGLIQDFRPIEEHYPPKIKKRIIKDLDQAYFPDKIIVPYIDIVHDRIMLEVFRGCIRGCRFCQAGFIYRPVREKSEDRLLDLAIKLVENTGYENISLTSLSTSDYSELKSFTEKLVQEIDKLNVNVSLPSLRIDSFSLDLMEKIQKVRKSGITFAPEAGSQRLRNIINKGVTEEDLINSVTNAFKGGWNTVKLYFMLGLPCENYDDIEGIHKLCEKVMGCYRQIRGDIRRLNINLSTSYFVPKPFTPFQWEAQDSIPELSDKQKFLKSKLRSKHIKYSWHEGELSLLEAVFARGDRRLGKVLINAFKLGCKFDAWNEHFDFSKWIKAFQDANIDMSFYANRKRDYEEVLPWDHIDIGVTKEFFIKESQRSYKELLTPNCRKLCANCGITSMKGGACF